MERSAHHTDLDLDASALTPFHQRILAHGVRGGDGSDDPPGTGGDTPPEGDTPSGDAPPAEGDTPPEGDPAPAGDTDTPPAEALSVPELPGDLNAAEEDALRDLHGTLETTLGEIPEGTSNVARAEVMGQVRERQQAIVDELDRRAQVEREAQDRIAELPADAPALPDRTPVMASAAAVAQARGAQPPAAQDPPAPAPERPRVAMQAAAGSHVVPAGHDMDLGHLGEAIDRVKRGRTDEAILASLPEFTSLMQAGAELPEPLGDSISRNNTLIREAVEDWEALDAGEQPARQGAICEPLDIIREIPNCFATVEPVASSLPSRPAGRLGFQFTPSRGLEALAAGAVLWDEDNQVSVDPEDPSTWKPCVEAVCVDPQECRAVEAVACLTFDVTTDMSSPETIEDQTNALNANRLRVKEGRLLANLDALSSAYTFAGSYGALTALKEAIETAIAQATFAQRITDPSYTLYVDVATLRVLSIDRANRAFGQGCGEGDVASCLTEIDGVARVVPTVDAAEGGQPGLPFAALNTPGEAAVALPDLHGTRRIRLVDPRDALYATTGQLDVGVARSPEMFRQNKAQYFSREHFMLCKHGCRPWFSIDVDLCADGGRAGFVDPHGCPTTS